MWPEGLNFSEFKALKEYSCSVGKQGGEVFCNNSFRFVFHTHRHCIIWVDSGHPCFKGLSGFPSQPIWVWLRLIHT